MTAIALALIGLAAAGHPWARWLSCDTGVLERLRQLCLDLPESHEVMVWGEPTFRVRNRIFAMYASAASHHGGGRPAVWLKAGPGEQYFAVKVAPERLFFAAVCGQERLDRCLAR